MEDIEKDMKRLDVCRICKNPDMTRYLDLGSTPLANAILTRSTLEKGTEKSYPLEVMYCPKCHLSQLSVVVDPKIMFSNYPYRSSVSKTFQDHCREIAQIFSQSFGFKKGDLVLDIASNDGCMLNEFKEEGFSVLGVDPAENLAEIANNNGIETICAFWNQKIAKEIKDTKGPAKIITATNVFAHVDDLNSFVEAVKILLSEDGIFMIEAPHALNMINNTEFDTIYHEHLSYLLVKPLEYLFSIHGMRIFRVDETDIHGGSIRVYVCHNQAAYDTTPSVDEVIEKEKSSNLHSIDGYREFSAKVEKIKKDLKETLERLKQDNKTVAAYGASAKGNTLLNYFQIIENEINFIADDTPEKQGRFAPGSHIPIVPSEEIMIRKPDYLVLLAWNFARELMKKTEDFERRGGKYIIPIPQVKITTSKDRDN